LDKLQTLGVPVTDAYNALQTFLSGGGLELAPCGVLVVNSVAIRTSSRLAPASLGLQIRDGLNEPGSPGDIAGILTSLADFKGRIHAPRGYGVAHLEHSAQRSDGARRGGVAKRYHQRHNCQTDQSDFSIQ
jgi:hypothetical protein